MHKKFRGYSVGLWGTGTKSIARIFGNYRAAHEFWQKKTRTFWSAYERGGISKKRFLTYLRKRDAAGQLEMDSDNFHSFYLDLLDQEFTGAKYIFTLRDCYSWCESQIEESLTKLIGMKKHLIRSDSQIYSLVSGGSITGAFASEGKNIDAALRAMAKEKIWREWLDRKLEKHAAQWARLNKSILRQLPPARFLLVRSHEISDSLERMADFMAISAQTLTISQSHSNRMIRPYGIFEKFGYRHVQNKLDAHCAPLMRQYFPEGNINEYCARRRPAASLGARAASRRMNGDGDLYHEAISCQRRGADVQALAILKRLARRYPMDSNLFGEMAISRCRLGLMEEARTDLKMAIRLNPAGSANSWLCASDIIARSGYRKQGLQALLRALKIQTDDEVRRQILAAYRGLLGQKHQLPTSA